MIELVSALTLGLLGSFHCAGMCGPIALILPFPENNKWAKLYGGLIYHLGKIISYAILGIIFGSIGSGISLSGFQYNISFIMGILMIVFALISIIFKNNTSFNIPFLNALKIKLGNLLSVKKYNSVFLIGLLNGFLPCGLVYIALAGAISSASIYKGALFMIFFGLGTLPMLLAISVIGSSLSLNIRRKITKFIPLTIILIGALFILRGSRLGIPYLSPDADLKIENHAEKPACCKYHIKE